MDNLGKVIAGFFRSPTTANQDVSLIDINGTPRTIRVYGAVNVVFTDSGQGSGLHQGQVGEGVTIPTRQDTDIEQPFTNGGIEDNPVGSISGGYSSLEGKLTMPTLISPTTGSGTITEAVRIQRWIATDGLPYDFLIFRDLISPVSVFIAGQAINMEHVMLI